MKKFILLFFLMNSIVSVAQNIETVVLKDGSRLSGYVQVQYPGKYMIVTAEEAEVVIPASMVTTIENNQTSVDDLSDCWAAWSGRNRHFVKETDGVKKLNLSRLSLKNGGMVGNQELMAYSIGSYNGEAFDKHPGFILIPHDVFIIERGENLKYVSLGKNSYYVPFKAVKEIVRESRQPEELTGVLDEIVTRDGTIVRGKLVRQIPGVSLSIENENGLLEVISNKDVLIQRRLPFNEKMTISEQSILLDVMKLKNEEELTGVLVEQNYGTAGNPGYFVLIGKEGTEYRKNLSELKFIQKVENPGYKEIRDVILEKNEFLVNRIHADVVPVRELEVRRDIVGPSDKFFHVEKLTANVIPADSPYMVLNYDGAGMCQIVLEFRDGISNEFYVVKPIERKNKGVSYETFSEKEFVSSRIAPVAKESSKNRTIKLTFEVQNLNKFLIYNPIERIAVFCRIPE